MATDPLSAPRPALSPAAPSRERHVLGSAVIEHAYRGADGSAITAWVKGEPAGLPVSVRAVEPCKHSVLGAQACRECRLARERAIRRFAHARHGVLLQLESGGGALQAAASIAWVLHQLGCRHVVWLGSTVLADCLRCLGAVQLHRPRRAAPLWANRRPGSHSG